MKDNIYKRSKPHKEVAAASKLDVASTYSIVYVITLADEFVKTLNNEYVILLGTSSERAGKNKFLSFFEKIVNGLAKIDKYLNEQSAFDKHTVVLNLQNRLLIKATKAEKAVASDNSMSKNIIIQARVIKTGTSQSDVFKVKIEQNKIKKEQVL